MEDVSDIENEAIQERMNDAQIIRDFVEHDSHSFDREDLGGDLDIELLAIDWNIPDLKVNRSVCINDNSFLSESVNNMFRVNPYYYKTNPRNTPS